MDDPKSRQELEQKIVKLEHSLHQEKLKSVEELLAHRLVFSAIVLVIVFLILCAKLEDASAGVQWLCYAPFFGVVLVVVGTIGNKYNRDKKDAQR
jgi:hypothetical protein